MRKVILLIALATCCFNSYSQQSGDTSANQIMKHRAFAFRIEFQDETGKWLKSDTLQNHLIVVDFPKSTITVYSNTKEKSLDIIDKLSVTKNGTAADYTYKCVDEENKECTAIFAFLDNKLLYMKLDYVKYRLMYMMYQ